MFRQTSPIPLLLVILVHFAYTILVGEGCRCPPTSRDFKRQFVKAHVVVRAYVLSQFTSCHLCPKPSDRRNAIRVYALYTHKQFKGPRAGSVFYAQAFDNIKFCGVRLLTGQTYMLNLADPKKISKASHWTPGWFVLQACQSHYAWATLNGKQQAFLYSRL